MFKKVKALYDKYILGLGKFLGKYPTEVHIGLILWNGFITSWATKTNIPVKIEEIGLNFNLNATAQVDYIQKHLHLSTHFIGSVAFLLNAVVYYVNWKKRHTERIAEEAQKVAIHTQTLANEAQSVATEALAAANKAQGE